MLLQFLRALLLSCRTKFGGNRRINEELPYGRLPEVVRRLPENRGWSGRGMAPEFERHLKGSETLDDAEVVEMDILGEN
ncbi:hypothetical protein HanRHA438_Chr00c17g0851351 [Helianthus annuus]|nr:hypothetical protein HanRHA438_Chr00c17g0851351 [Helianthus annuus]